MPRFMGRRGINSYVNKTISDAINEYRDAKDAQFGIKRTRAERDADYAADRLTSSVRSPKQVMNDLVASVTEGSTFATLPKLSSNLQNAVGRIAKNEVSGGIKEIISDSRDRKRSVAKQRSDYIYNERRRAKRLVNRLELDIVSMTGAEKRATRSLINALNREIQKTYAPRKGTRRAEERQMSAVKALERITRGTGRNATLTRAERNEAVFRHQLNLASKGNVSIFGRGEEARMKAKVFFRSTQDIWQGLPNEQRLQAIKNFYGTEDLNAIFDAVIDANAEVLMQAERDRAEYISTDENDFFYSEEEFVQPSGSPTYLDFVVSAVYIAL